jgi:hypothetical protein
MCDFREGVKEVGVVFPDRVAERAAELKVRSGPIEPRKVARFPGEVAENSNTSPFTRWRRPWALRLNSAAWFLVGVSNDGTQVFG